MLRLTIPLQVCMSDQNSLEKLGLNSFILTRLRSIAIGIMRSTPNFSDDPINK